MVRHQDGHPVIGTVVVTSRSFSSGSLDLVARLQQSGIEVVRASSDHDLAALREPLADAVAWIAGTAPIRAPHLDLAPRLKIIARYGVGVDAVDLAAADERGVTVTNTPGANSEAVAEHAIALLMSVLRAVPHGDRQVRLGDWSVTRGRQLTGSLTGVIGLGRVGRGVVARLRGLGCTVLAHDPWVEHETARALGAEPVSVDRVVAECGVVSLHAPGGQTLVGQEWVTACATQQIIVNTARADLVDEAVVAEALRSGRLGGYAADTLRTESAPGSSPLLSSDLGQRVVLTPHVAAQTTESVDLMGSMAVNEVVAVLNGGRPDHPVIAQERAVP